MVAYCVDRYIASQIQRHDGPSVSSKYEDHEMIEKDDRLEAIVDRMFERCIEDKQYEQVCYFVMYVLIAGTRSGDRSTKR